MTPTAFGEAASRVSPEFREPHPSLLWAQMMGLRNVIVHANWQVDHDLLWNTITDDLPPLRDQLRVLLSGKES